MTLNFASDNTGPVAPEIMDAIVRANAGYALPYGNDPATTRVGALVRETFAMPDGTALLVTVGTAANALALSTLVAPYETVFCHRIAHIERDECGAPEFFSGGAKLTLVDGVDAKMTPDALRAAIERTGLDVHTVQRGAVSLTNVTELGTVYTLAELRALLDVADDYGLGTHLDGARFANACAALGCSAAQMAEGFDMISFGGTKNGCMGVEALIIRDPQDAQQAHFRRKRAGHLWSKNRYLAAQMEAYLTDDLWLSLAQRSNASGQRLAAGLRALGVSLAVEPAANMIFFDLPRAGHNALKEKGVQYNVDGALTGDPTKVLTGRLVCDWSKSDADIDALLALVQAI